MAEMKRFWVAAVLKPRLDGTMSAELASFHTTTDREDSVIESTIHGMIERIEGWECGEIKRVQGFEGRQGVPVTLADVLSRHSMARMNRIRREKQSV